MWEGECRVLDGDQEANSFASRQRVSWELINRWPNFTCSTANLVLVLFLFHEEEEEEDELR